MQAPRQAKNKSDTVQTDTSRIARHGERLVDTRPTALAQRKLAEMMNTSPRVVQQRARSEAMHNSPRMVAQRHEMNALHGGAISLEETPNRTGLPNHLKSGIESLSGMSMDQVKVHYNSDKPAQLQAHAYAQGNDIHLGAGQERHLPHEAWHVVQQAQGRVRPTMQMKASAINDDPLLEKEADAMGDRATQLGGDTSSAADLRPDAPVQRRKQEQAPHDARTNQLRPYPEPGNNSSGPVFQRALATYEAIHAADNGAHPIIDNRPFNASPQPNQIGAGSQDSGLGVTRNLEHGGGQHGISLRTQVDWSAPRSDGQHADGTTMSALLGPDHKRGSAPGSSGDWVARRVKLSTAAGKHEYIAGHLLNHNLGGPGSAAQNLAAIPAEINKAHSDQIEEDVKTQVNDYGAWGQYEVRITHDNDAGSAGLLYASRLQATWTPYALDREAGPNGTPGNFKFSMSSGQQISVDLGIPAPSVYKQAHSIATSKADAPKALINKRALPVAGATALAPLYTPFKFDELPLTPRTSLIVGIGIGNVLLIKKLEAEKAKLGEQSAAAETAKVELKKSVDEYEGKLEQLESEKAALLQEAEENEVEAEMARQRQLAEAALREQLLAQIEVITAEKRDRAQIIGGLAGRLGDDPDQYVGSMSPTSASRFDDGFENAVRDSAMAQDVPEYEPPQQQPQGPRKVTLWSHALLPRHFPPDSVNSLNSQVAGEQLPSIVVDNRGRRWSLVRSSSFGMTLQRED